MREAGFHQFQVAAVAGWALRLAADGVREALGAECPHGAADFAVVKVGVEDDVEDVVEQLEPLEVRLERVELALGDDVAGAGVGRAEHHVEHADRLVDDLGVRRAQRGEQYRVAPLGVHQAQCPRR